MSTTKVATTRIHDLHSTCLPLHDDTFLEIRTIETVPIFTQLHRLQFRHVAGKEGDKDNPIHVWAVEARGPIYQLKEGGLREDLRLLDAGDCTKPIETTQIYAKYLWCTLYWYFNLPLRKWPENATLGAPCGENEVRITASDVGIHQKYLYELESVGFLACSSTCATIRSPNGYNAENEEEDQFFIKEKQFWQIPFNAFYNNPTRIRRQEGEIPFIMIPIPQPLDFLPLGLHSRHPRRPKPPRPGETFYKRYIPSLQSFLTFRTADLSTEDVGLLYKWMNNPRVNHFWGESGTILHQQRYLEKALNSKHSFPVIASWKEVAFNYNKENGELDYDSLVVSDGEKKEEPFGYFEIYWVKEDRLSAHTETGDWDRGVHVLVGEEKFRGPHRVKVWLSSLVHYMLLSDPRTQTLMLEPRADNDKFIDYLVKAGFYKEKEFAFPHKQAAVMKMKREAWSAPEC